MAESKIKREVAWRVFAREFNSASVDLPGDEQYTPSYLLSPLGALINRVYLTGVLTECENAGTELEPLWRGRVSDPTDIFYISAGQFQPKAARELAELEPPKLVGIVGKARTYSPEDGTLYVSVRVESVKEISQEIRDYWVLETCKSLKNRLSCLAEALRMDPPETKKLVALGYSNKISTGVMEAVNQYGAVDIQQYSDLLLNTLNELNISTSTDTTLLGTESTELGANISENNDTGIDEPPLETQMKSADMDNPESDEILGDDNLGDKSGEQENNSDEDKAALAEQLIFEIINSLVEEKPDGVAYEDIQAHAIENGLEKEIIEESIGSLIDKGEIYEPTIGIFKAV